MLFALAAAVGTASWMRAPSAVLSVISGVAPMPSTWPDTAGASATSPLIG
jgi:hypothetical protein